MLLVKLISQFIIKFKKIIIFSLLKNDFKQLNSLNWHNFLLKIFKNISALFPPSFPQQNQSN